MASKVCTKGTLGHGPGIARGDGSKGGEGPESRTSRGSRPGAGTVLEAEAPPGQPSQRAGQDSPGICPLV